MKFGFDFLLQGLAIGLSLTQFLFASDQFTRTLERRWRTYGEESVHSQYTRAQVRAGKILTFGGRCFKYLSSFPENRLEVIRKLQSEISSQGLRVISGAENSSLNSTKYVAFYCTKSNDVWWSDGYFTVCLYNNSRAPFKENRAVIRSSNTLSWFVSSDLPEVINSLEINFHDLKMKLGLNLGRDIIRENFGKLTMTETLILVDFPGSAEEIARLFSLKNLEIRSTYLNGEFDLNPLKNLEKLKKLDLNKMWIQDLAVVRSLNRLESLTLRSQCKLKDSSLLFLVNHPNLKELNLTPDLGFSQNLADLSPLLTLPKLEKLRLAGSEWKNSPVVKSLEERGVLVELVLPDGRVNKGSIRRLKARIRNSVAGVWGRIFNR